MCRLLPVIEHAPSELRSIRATYNDRFLHCVKLSQDSCGSQVCVAGSSKRHARCFLETKRFLEIKNINP